MNAADQEQDQHSFKKVGLEVYTCFIQLLHLDIKPKAKKYRKNSDEFFFDQQVE